MEGGFNVSNARLTHWCHDRNNHSNATNMVESQKNPGENRTWYVYPGQGSPNNSSVSGTQGTVIYVARLLPGGATQLRSFTYNNLGNILTMTDPVGRQLSYTYAGNNRDVTKLANTTGGANEVLSTTTYNSSGQPLVITNVAGQTTTNLYNSYGQLTSVTDAAGNATTYSYNVTSHQLTSVVGSVSGNSTSLTYDSYGRVATNTDGDGYCLAYGYDALDRPTTITYPNGDYAEIDYVNLDPVWHRSRDGKWSYTYYNTIRLPTLMVTPDGSRTQLVYCVCGVLQQMIDANGNVTKMGL